MLYSTLGDDMITLSKIAKLANVSVSTASKAFAGSGEVNDETREMIFNIAKEHGCFKRFYNVKYPKLVIGIIAPEFSSGYYTEYLSYIQKNLELANCELCVSTTDFSSEREEALIEYYYKHSNVDGIIIVNSLLSNYNNLEIPVVFVNPRNEFSNTCVITNDINLAFRQSIEFLVGKGVDKIGFIGESLTVKYMNCLKKFYCQKVLYTFLNL